MDNTNAAPIPAKRSPLLGVLRIMDDCEAREAVLNELYERGLLAFHNELRTELVENGLVMSFSEFFADKCNQYGPGLNDGDDEKWDETMDLLDKYSENVVRLTEDCRLYVFSHGSVLSSEAWEAGTITFAPLQQEKAEDEQAGA